MPGLWQVMSALTPMLLDDKLKAACSDFASCERCGLITEGDILCKACEDKETADALAALRSLADEDRPEMTP